LDQVRASDVLVIGSAGFTFPRDASRRDFVRQVDAVDVDPAVKDIAEREFLREPLSPKVRFLPLSARYAVRRLAQEHRRYGFTLVDAFIGRGIPDELVTVEFFGDVRAVSDRTALNVIMDHKLESNFARGLLAAFRQAFGAAHVRRVKPNDTGTTNILVTSWAAPGSSQWTDAAAEPYRDDRNRADRDHVYMMWNSDEE
jgi:spermidine synthase